MGKSNSVPRDQETTGSSDENDLDALSRPQKSCDSGCSARASVLK